MMESKSKRRKQFLPNNLIFRVLRRLPAKSLLRFKCVCKAWYSFVSELKYVNRKLILSSSSSIQSVDLDEASASDNKIKAVQIEFASIRSFKVIGSCNGLLCVAVQNQGLGLWNPCTESYKHVPVSSPLKDFTDQIGFGYDHSTGDFKIVRIFHCGKREVEIYSLKTDSWQKGCLPWQIIFIVESQSGTFVNGALHWKIQYVKNFEPSETFVDAILRYDLKDQQFSKVVLPEDLGKSAEFDLGDFGGRLCAVQYHDAGHVDMWAREDNGREKQKWIKLMSIPRLDGLPSDHNKVYLVPICFMRSGEVLMKIKRRKKSILMLNRLMEPEIGFKGRKFCLYSPAERVFREFEIQDLQLFDKETTYTESLVSPIIRDGGDQERLSKEEKKDHAGITTSTA